MREIALDRRHTYRKPAFERQHSRDTTLLVLDAKKKADNLVITRNDIGPGKNAFGS